VGRWTGTLHQVRPTASLQQAFGHRIVANEIVHSPISQQSLMFRPSVGIGLSRLTALHNRGTTMQPLELVRLVSIAVPTLILIAIDLWLRLSREVRDQTLWWLWAACLTWTLSAAIACLYPASSTLVAYLLSPVNSFFFVGATFHLDRVRELLGEEQANRYFKWSARVIAAIGAITICLVLSPVPGIGHFLDTVASCLTSALLGWGLWHSFRRYAHPLMAYIAVAVCASMAVRQIIAAGTGNTTMWFVMTGVGVKMALMMTLVTLTLAWSFAKSTKFVIVGEPTTACVAALFIDLRQSTAWANRIDSSERVSSFMNALQIWAVECGLAHFGIKSRLELTKFLGDGYLLVWEAPETIDTYRRATAVGLALHDGFAEFKQARVTVDRMPDDFPHDVGLGLDIGRVLRLTSASGLRDYLGKAMNYAAKFQAMTKRDGGLVIAEATWEQLEAETQQRFPHTGVLQILGSTDVRVRGTRPFG